MNGRTGNPDPMGNTKVENGVLRLAKRFHSPFRVGSARGFQRGFTLLELMIVMFIMVILVTVALPMYQRSVVHAREAVLREDLFKMRSLIDQYAADKGKLPQSLDDLVTASYMREIPKDPITDEPTWNAVTGEDPNSREGEQGVIDVHSLSEDTSTEGTPYSAW